MQVAVNAAANRAWPEQPFFGGNERCTNAFRPGIKLVHDRPPPRNHVGFRFNRTWRCSVDGNAMTLQLIFFPFGFVKPEQANKHGRHPLAVGYAVAFN